MWQRGVKSHLLHWDRESLLAGLGNAEARCNRGLPCSTNNGLCIKYLPELLALAFPVQPLPLSFFRQFQQLEISPLPELGTQTHPHLAAGLAGGCPLPCLRPRDQPGGQEGEQLGANQCGEAAASFHREGSFRAKRKQQLIVAEPSGDSVPTASRTLLR